MQYLIVTLIVLTALALTIRSIARKRHSFSTKPNCETNCGCGTTDKAK